MPVPALRRRFRRRLLGWYARHGRDLPWRRTRDPYRILVSEIMLQQTQVDRVLPKYQEWLTRFPTFASLAAARPRQAQRAWYPLGYNIRPKRLHSIAKEVVATYGGKLPPDRETLQSFKGLGRIHGRVPSRSFAFGERAAIVDTNVARVLGRVFAGNGRPHDIMPVRRWTWDALGGAASLVVRSSTSTRRSWIWERRSVSPASPKCGVCPMRPICQDFHRHDPHTPGGTGGGTNGVGVTTA